MCDTITCLHRDHLNTMAGYILVDGLSFQKAIAKFNDEWHHGVSLSADIIFLAWSIDDGSRSASSTFTCFVEALNTNKLIQFEL